MTEIKPILPTDRDIVRDHKRFREMTKWFDPKVLIQTGIQAVITSIFAQYADGRPLQALQDIQLQNYVQQRIVIEQQQAQQAAVAFAVLAGVAAVGICSSRGGCGGGGGGNNYQQQSHQGCCSWHRGIFHTAYGSEVCSGGRLLCNDGRVSPSCGC